MGWCGGNTRYWLRELSCELSVSNNPVLSGSNSWLLFENMQLPNDEHLIASLDESLTV